MTEPSFRDPIPETCDFLVIGAGPAGLSAAHRLASRGAGTVVLIDRRDPWREPVACAEGVMRPCLEDASPLPIDPWIKQEIHSARFATVNAHFDWRNRGHGLIIDRARMHADLARDVARLGAACHFRCRAVALSERIDGFRTLRFDGEIHGSIRARCVLDASGPGTGFGRAEGLVQGDLDLEPAAFALVDGLDFDPEAIQMWLSQEFAPGGYAWLFPAGGKRANVGVVCAKGTSVSPREGLKRFLAHLAPGAPLPPFFGGAIPCAKGGGTPLAAELLFKVGDAASMVHPLGRSGITEALRAGREAADQAILALADPDERTRRKRYESYRRTYRKGWGREHAGTALIKPLVARIDDRVWDRLFRKLSATPDGHHTWTGIFAIAASVLPLALWTLRPRPARRGTAEA